MKRNIGKEVRVGALIALGFLIIFMAFFVIGNQQGIFTRKFELKAKFMNVEGLTVGASVRLGGVKIGSVNRVGFSPQSEDKRIIVTMSVNAASFERIRKDSMAKLGSQGLLGDRTVEISVGSAAAERTIQGEYVATMETPQINDLISEGGDAMTDIKITAHNANEIAWKINHGTGSLAQIINDPRLYMSLDSLLNLWTYITIKINKGEGTLAKIINDPSLYDNLNASLSEIRTLMSNVNAGEGSLGKIVKRDDIYNHIDSLLANIDETMAKINAGSGTMARVVNNDDLYQKVNNTMDALNSLIVDIKQNPKKYVKLSIF